MTPAALLGAKHVCCIMCTICTPPHPTPHYTQARRRLDKRPWRVDDCDDFLLRVYGPEEGSNAPQEQQKQQLLQTQEAKEEAAEAAGTEQLQQQQQQQPDAAGLPAAGASGAPPPPPVVTPDSDKQQSSPAAAAAATHRDMSPPFRRVMVFVDNAGADIVLGMLPFVRELLRLGCEVVMVANTLPAINDITAAELRRCTHTCRNSPACTALQELTSLYSSVLLCATVVPPPFPLCALSASLLPHLPYLTLSANILPAPPDALALLLLLLPSHAVCCQQLVRCVPPSRLRAALHLQLRRRVRLVDLQEGQQYPLTLG